ncbi:MAG TPA: hypothetical protein DDX06_04835 [Curvibacter sp.]|nr:hypothetical protein [Curvibacter sp.]
MNNFFTHDQMAQAVQRLHPGAIHGRHFLILMGISEADGSPASDAWIERWNIDGPIPTMQQLRDAYAAWLAVENAHPRLVEKTLKKARALRPPIMSILDGMQASAINNGTTIMVNQQPVPLSDVIEGCKQALKDLPNTVDLSQCTTQQQMELVVLQAYHAIVAAAPPEIKSAFDSLKP